MVVEGAASGIVLGMISARYIASLLYEVKPGDLAMFAFPSLAILGVTVLAALPAIVRAVRMDPVASLRSE